MPKEDVPNYKALYSHQQIHTLKMTQVYQYTDSAWYNL